jgi:hypothetical protein
MSTFESEFLDNYLKFGLGSMPKADVDALVMSLLDKYGLNGSGPLASLGNQTTSERLKTPVSKIKKLRYEAALKFGGRVEDQARGRLLAALANATLEPDGTKICLIIEDSLAKNWLQGQLKIYQHILIIRSARRSSGYLPRVFSRFSNPFSIIGKSRCSRQVMNVPKR